MKKHLSILALLALASCSTPHTQSEVSSLASVDTTATAGGTSGTGDRTVTISPSTGTLVVVLASVSGNTQIAPPMSDSSGGTYALVSRAPWSGGANNMLAYAREAPTSGGSLTITLDTNTNTAAQLTAVSYAGMTRFGASAVRQVAFVGDQSSGTVPALVLPSAADANNPTIVAVASGDTTTTPPYGWTERHDSSQATPTTALEVATRDLGFNCEDVAFQGTQSTSYAAMLVELDASQGPPPPDAGPDAPVPDSGPDAPPPTFSLGAHGTVYQLYGTGHNPAQVTLDTEATGSTFLVAVGGKTSDIDNGPTDNKGNTYALVGINDYADWPGYGSAIWKATGGGGTSHTWSQYVTDWDEDTTIVVEAKGAGTNPSVTSTFTQHDNSGTYAPWLSGSRTLTATPITTTGPALILAIWYGAGPPSWGNHVATPDNDFTVIEGYGVDNPNGYIQVWLAYKIVSQAGTYGTTWTYSPSQGAQLWMVALQPN